MNKRPIAVLAVLLLGGAVAAAVLATGGDDGDGAVAGPATTTTTTLPLDDTAEELVDRLARARQRDLHLVYSGALPGAPGGKLTVEMWWKGKLVRQSLVAETQQGRQESTAFVLDDGNVFCQRTGTNPWACQPAASTATAAGRDAGIIDSLVASLHGKNVTAEKAVVGGVDADCYTIDPATGDVVCLRRDDVPVKFTFSGAELVVATVDTTVADSVFEPPAEVQEAPAPTTATTG